MVSKSKPRISMPAWRKTRKSNLILCPNFFIFGSSKIDFNFASQGLILSLRASGEATPPKSDACLSVGTQYFAFFPPAEPGTQDIASYKKQNMPLLLSRKN